VTLEAWSNAHPFLYALFLVVYLWVLPLGVTHVIFRYYKRSCKKLGIRTLMPPL
jgi:hypothetical protein